MKKVLVNAAIFFAITNLTACSNAFFDSTSEPGAMKYRQHVVKDVQPGDSTKPAMITEAANGPRLSGAMAMDENDRSKMFHALDLAPGKSTHWVNGSTGVSYTVVPTKKVTLDGNPYCREYETTAKSGDKEHKSYGTACVGTDGSWHSA